MPLRVRGRVEHGQLLGPSGLHDGTAVALSPPISSAVVGAALSSTCKMIDFGAESQNMVRMIEVAVTPPTSSLDHTMARAAPFSFRARCSLGMLALLALSCVLLGAGTTLEQDALDSQISAAARRCAPARMQGGVLAVYGTTDTWQKVKREVSRNGTFLSPNSCR